MHIILGIFECSWKVSEVCCKVSASYGHNRLNLIKKTKAECHYQSHFGTACVKSISAAYVASHHKVYTRHTMDWSGHA